MKAASRTCLAWTAVVVGFGAMGVEISGAENAPEEKKEDEKATYGFKLGKEEDSIEPLMEKVGVVFRIGSKSGMGNAEITLNSGQWPKNITLRFVKAAEYLEYFLADNGAVKLSGKLDVRPKSVSYYDQNGQKLSDNKKAVFTLAIAYNKDERLMEVVLPPEFCRKDTKTLRFEWIDAFRR